MALNALLLQTNAFQNCLPFDFSKRKLGGGLIRNVEPIDILSLAC